MVLHVIAVSRAEKDCRSADKGGVLDVSVSATLMPNWCLVQSSLLPDRSAFLQNSPCWIGMICGSFWRWREMARL
jgi:hypothetical protein